MDINIVSEPSVFLVSRPEFILENAVAAIRGNSWEYEGDQTDADLLCEFAGRFCYDSFGDRQKSVGTAEYLDNLMDKGHGSVLEHANFSFVVIGASRGFTHQAVRHRAGFAYSQESTHFIEYNGGSYCVPDWLMERYGEKIMALLEHSTSVYAGICNDVMDTGSIVHAGDTKKRKLMLGQVRGFLNICIQSRITMTANIRALRHFMESRGSDFNVPETRKVASLMCGIMKGESSCFDDFKMFTADDGVVALSSKYRKV